MMSSDIVAIEQHAFQASCAQALSILTTWLSPSFKFHKFLLANAADVHPSSLEALRMFYKDLLLHCPTIDVNT